MARRSKLKLVWMPQATEGVGEIERYEKRVQLRSAARMLVTYPEMHKLRKTRSWGYVGILRVSPFVAVYRVSGYEVQILDVLREEYLVSREIDEE